MRGLSWLISDFVDVLQDSNTVVLPCLISDVLPVDTVHLILYVIALFRQFDVIYQGN